MARNKLLSTTQAAAEFGFSPAYVARLAQEGKVKAQKIGRDWLIDRDAMLLYTNSWQARKPGPKRKDATLPPKQQEEDQK